MDPLSFEGKSRALSSLTREDWAGARYGGRRVWGGILGWETKQSVRGEGGSRETLELSVTAVLP